MSVSGGIGGEGLGKSRGMDELGEYLETERAKVEDALDRAVAAMEGAVPPTVLEAMRHGVLGGGKRLRPILCIAAFRACDGSAPSGAERAPYELAAALELIHAYSLMHDDLPCMDDAELRRGRPTTHREHGEVVTMRAGAALIPAAALHALRACERLALEPERARTVAALLLRGAGAGGMVGGQWEDLKAEGVTLEAPELDALHRRKTGALLTASLEIGGLAARASESELDALRSYGAQIGLAFQIADDVLDATQSAETLGKNPSDEVLDKATYVSLHGIADARRRAAELSAGAVEALEGAGLATPVLVALARYVVSREH